MKLTKPILLFLSLGLLSFIAMQERTYTVRATIYEWETILQVIDQSNAPHTSVKLAQRIITEQVQAKLKQEFKADSLKQDSVKKKGAGK